MVERGLRVWSDSGVGCEDVGKQIVWRKSSKCFGVHDVVGFG